MKLKIHCALSLFDEYNEIKEKYPEVLTAFCVEKNADGSACIELNKIEDLFRLQKITNCPAVIDFDDSLYHGPSVEIYDNFIE